MRSVQTDQGTYYELSHREVRDLDEAAITRRFVKIGVAAILGLLILIWAWRLVAPQYVLYRESVERRVLVEQAQAEADAAVHFAAAEIARANGVAEANRIISSSIDEQYIRWLYVDQLDQIEGQIIYIPTEAGLPILEAGR